MSEPGPMVRLVLAMLGPALRLAGARPSRVAILARGLARQTHGLQEEQRGEAGSGPDPELLRVLVLVLLALFSLLVAVVVVRLGDRPELATLVLLAAQLGGVLLRSGGEVVPLVLDADDRRVLGWWPVSERELLLARGGVLLQGVAEATVAVAALPLLLLAIRGEPPVVAAVGAGAGLALHGVAVAAVLLLWVQGLARLAGRRRARRFTEALGTMTLIVLINLLARAPRAVGGWLEGLAGWQELLLPPLWFAAWGGWGRPLPGQMLGAGLALVAVALLVGLGARALGTAARGEDAGEVRGGAGGRDWSAPLAAWVGRWLPGRQGRAVRLLLVAHLREDWRLLGVLFGVPILMTGYLVLVTGWRPPPGSVGATGAADWAAPLGLLLSVLGLSLASALGCSAEPAAGWLVRSGVLDAPRLLALQRRLVRALVPAPLLTVTLLATVIAGRLSPGQALLAAVPAWLALEIMLAFVQLVLPAAPFSRPWQRQGHGGRAFQLLAVVVWPVAVLPLFLVFDRGWWGPPVVVAVQALTWLTLRRLGRRRVARAGLPGLLPRT